ncbi:MAG: hypothetical protein ACYSR9_00175 [Planctomycetota bacterium]|jgi:hypothetical protein
MQLSKRFNRIIIGLTAGIFLSSFVWVSLTEATPTKKSLLKRNRGGAVTVEVTYMNPIQNVAAGKLVFEVEMNTHSVDLESYTIEKISLLRNDKGAVIQAQAWDKPEGGGHHRSGELVFSNTDDSGKPVVTSETKFIELVIKNLSGVKERIFRWNLNN